IAWPKACVAQCLHQSMARGGGNALQTIEADAVNDLARRVVDGKDLNSRTRTPVEAGWATYFSSAGRAWGTKGSAFSMATIRSGPKKERVSSSARMSGHWAFSPA